MFRPALRLGPSRVQLLTQRLPRPSTTIARPLSPVRPLTSLRGPRPIVLLTLPNVQRRLASSPSGPKSDDKSRPDLANAQHGSHANVVKGAGDEIKGITRDIAEMISGRSGSGPVVDAAAAMAGAREVSSHSHHGRISDDFSSITRTLISSVPQPAMLVGLAGTIPYVGTALGTIFLAREASRASQGLNTLVGGDMQSILESLHTLEAIQITYGAIILSFLGAIHWGMEFSKYGGSQGYGRLAIGVLPVLFAWPTTFLPHGTALVAQWLGFTGTWFLDQRASTMGWTPPWYATYRFYLSIIVGVSIIMTFAGTGYYGAGAGATTDAKSTRYLHTSERVSPLKRLERLNEAKHPKGHEIRVNRVEEEVSGDVESDEADDEGGHYLVLRNIKKEHEEEEKEAEERKQKEEEDKKKNQEFQDKRDQKQQEKAPGDMKKDAANRTGANPKADNKGKDDGGDDKGGDADGDKAGKADEKGGKDGKEVDEGKEGKEGKTGKDDGKGKDGKDDKGKDGKDDKGKGKK